jgi:cyanophycinase-like exopeptidase
MICDESARSERQRAQRRWEVAPVRKSEGSVSGDEALEMELVRNVEVLDWRLRKGREGTRYVGNGVAAEGMFMGRGGMVCLINLW